MAKRDRHAVRKKRADLVASTSLAEGTWIWCLHCARCYQAGEYRQQGAWQMCPYPDCDGDTIVDSVLWSQRCQFHPEFPTIPERNKVYPLG
jgi:hypothetical protein